MAGRRLWQRAESLATRILGKTQVWPPGYLRFVLHGDPRCFEIPTHLTLQERLLLYRLGVELSRKATIVEIGSYLGASAAFLATAASEIDGQLFCVDTWQNDAMSEGARDTYAEFLHHTGFCARWITPLRGESVAVAQTFNRTIDLLFIDADHSYAAVKADLEHWAPKVRRDGWIVLHDWGWAEGVQRVVTEMIEPIQRGRPMTLPNLYAAQVAWSSWNRR